MKKKSILLLSILILAIFLTGCNGGVVAPATDEAKVKSVIQDYFLAINDQNWSKAKNCCIYGSDRYYATSVLEDGINALQQYYGTITITCFVTISDVTITGSYASADINLTMYATAGGYSESDSATATYYLQKVGNSWKIYAP